MDARHKGCRDNYRVDIVYRIIKRTDPVNAETSYLVVNKYSGKIEYVAETIDDAKSYIRSR